MRICMIGGLIALVGATATLHVASATATAAPSWIDIATMLRPDLGPTPTPEQVGQTWVEIAGEIHGAQPSDLGPIGGGEGYARIITEGDHNVGSIEELLEALEQAQPGDVVYLDPAGNYDLTCLFIAEDDFVIDIPEGVTLASNRGHNGSRGAVLHSGHIATRPMIRPLGPNVRITGLWLLGPDPHRRLKHHIRSFREERGSLYYYRLPKTAAIQTSHDGLEVDNCQVSGWTTGIALQDVTADHHIHHNYIHHMQRHGLGYGISGNSVSLIEYNLFNYNRHSIAASGTEGNAYEARHNVELGVAWGHCFDVHSHEGKAGDWVKISSNTFRGPSRAISIRGVPRERAEIYNNWFYHSAPDEEAAPPGERQQSAVVRPWPVDGDTRVEMYNNAFGLDSPTVH